MVSNDILSEIAVLPYTEDAEVGDNQSTITRDFCDERASNFDKQLTRLLDEIKGIRNAQDKLLWCLIAGVGTLCGNFLLELLKH